MADLIANELLEVATNDEAWGAKFRVLKENIEHHIKEEEGNMFRLARGIFSREELRLLAARMLKSGPAKPFSAFLAVCVTMHILIKSRPEGGHYVHNAKGRRGRSAGLQASENSAHV